MHGRFSEVPKCKECNFKNFAKSIEKIQTLLELTDKEFRKKFNISNTPSIDMEITQDYFMALKKFYQFYLLCLIELCNKLREIGLGFVGLALVQLFQSFKVHMAYFLKFNIFFFQMKISETEPKKETSENPHKDGIGSVGEGANEFTQDELNLLRKFLSKQRTSSSQWDAMNKFERMEKSRFFLEQELHELDQMVLTFNEAKDEVDEFIRKKINLSSIKPSGATKFLLNLVREAKVQSLKTSNILDNEIQGIDKRSFGIKDEKFIDEVKNEILNTVDQGQKKVLKQILKPKRKESMIQAGLSEAETQTEERGNSFSLSKQFQLLTYERNELLSKNEYYESQLKALSIKNHNLEKKSEEFEKQKESLILTRIALELKLERRKDKCKKLKIERDEILKKLEGLVDKDAVNKEILQRRTWELEKGQLSSEEHEKEWSEALKLLSGENSQLKSEIRLLKEENEGLKNSLQKQKNQLNEELLKNMKITKVLQALKQDKGPKRSSNIEKELPSEYKSLQAFSNVEKIEDEKLKKDENVIKLNLKEDPTLNKSPKNLNLHGEKKDETSILEMKLEKSEKLEAQTALKEDEDTKETEKKEFKKSKSKKSIFSKQGSVRNVRSLPKKEGFVSPPLVTNFIGNVDKIDMDNDQETDLPGKNIIKEKKHLKALLNSPKQLDSPDDSPKNQISSFKIAKRKTTVSFHQESESKLRAKSENFIEKYVDTIETLSPAERRKLVEVMRNISQMDPKGKKFRDLMRFIEIKELDLDEILKGQLKPEKSKKLNHQESITDMKLKITENKSNLDKGPIKTVLKNVERSSSKQQLKTLMNRPELTPPLDDIDSQLYNEFLRFKQDNNLDVLKAMILERIALDKEKINGNQPLFAPMKAIMGPKTKTKSIPSLNEFNFITPKEKENNKTESLMNANKKLPPSLNFGKENTVLSRELRTENGPRTTKSISAAFMSEEKKMNFERRESNNDILDEEDFLNKFESRENIYGLNQNKKSLEPNTLENFSKKKGFFKYPFRSIEKFEGMKAPEEADIDIFENMYRALVAKHEKCGPGCDHLKRFYTRIRFVSKHFQKEELTLAKNLINKLNINDEVD